jgi:hypothetical protein
MNEKMRAKIKISALVLLLIICSAASVEAREINNGTAYIGETITLANDGGALVGNCTIESKPLGSGGYWCSAASYLKEFDCTAGLNAAVLSAGRYCYYGVTSTGIACPDFSEDDVCTITIKNYEITLAYPCPDTAIGESLVVRGTTNKLDGTTITVTATGPQTLGTQSVTVTNGTFEARWDTTGITAGNYIFKASDMQTTDSYTYCNVGTAAGISANISASNTTPGLNENVTLTAAINKVGVKNATNVIVKFFIDTTEETYCAATRDINDSSVSVSCPVNFTSAGAYSARVETTCSMCGSSSRSVNKSIAINVLSASTQTTPTPTPTPTVTATNPKKSTPTPTARSTSTEYVCPDGSSASSPSDCPLEEDRTEVATGHGYKTNISEVNISEVKKQPAFEFVFALTAILAVAYLTRRGEYRAR